MPGMLRRSCATMLILLLLAGTCFPLHRAEAQESTETTSSSETSTGGEENQAETSTKSDSSTPQVTLPSFSYKDSKESTIGRALILSIGLFPFSYFYTGIVISVTRYVSNGFDSAYAPWSSSTSLSDSEMWTKIAVSSALSLVFGLLGAMLK